MFESPETAISDPTTWLDLLGARQVGFAPDRRFAVAAPTEPGPCPEEERQRAAQAELRRAVDEAFAAGLEQGRSEGEDTLAAERAAQERLRLSVAQLDLTLRREFAERLAASVTALCASTLAPLALDAEALQRRCMAAARLLGEAQERLELHLHPDDVVSLDPEFAAGWTIVPQPEFERGTLRIEGPDAGVVDGPAEWRAALEAAIAC